MAGIEERKFADEMNREKRQGHDSHLRAEEFFKANPHSVDFSGLEFVELTYLPCGEREYNFSKCRFVKCTLSNQSRNATFDDSVFEDCGMWSFLSHASAKRIHVRGGEWGNADLTETDLTDAVFGDGVNLRRARFHETKLDGTHFGVVEVDGATVFDRVKSCKSMSMDVYHLACLGDDYGGLTVGNRQDMIIRDDVGKLRSQFGGIWFWLHLIALLVFVLPYANFTIWRCTQARLVETVKHVVPPDIAEKLPLWNDSIPLWKALGNYIVSAGHEWRDTHFRWWFVVFVVFLGYNAVRFILLLKTKRLETELMVKGVPPKFSFDTSPGWKWAYYSMQAGWLVALLLALLNTCYFLTTEVPM